MIELSPAARPSEVSFTVRGNPVSQNQAWTIITWKPKAGSSSIDAVLKELLRLGVVGKNGELYQVTEAGLTWSRAMPANEALLFKALGRVYPQALTREQLAEQTGKTLTSLSAQPHASMKLTSEGLEFKLEVARVASLARPPDWDRENEYIVECVHYFDSRRPDHDGPGKLIFDAMADFEITIRGKTVSFVGLYKNDRQIWRSSQQKEHDPANPRTEITVRLRAPWRPVQQELIG